MRGGVWTWQAELGNRVLDLLVSLASALGWEVARPGISDSSLLREVLWPDVGAEAVS